MAARLNPRHSEMVRSKIRTVHLLKRLSDHVDGKVEMTPTQAQSAQFLISMALPKPVQQIEQTGEITIRWKS